MSSERDDEMWSRVQQANTPDRTEMRQAEGDLVRHEGKRAEASDAGPLPAPTKRRSSRGRRIAMAGAALLLAVSSIALYRRAWYPNRVPRSSTIPFQTALDTLRAPKATHSEWTAAIAAIDTRCSRGLKALEELGGSHDQACARAAREAILRLAAGTIPATNDSIDTLADAIAIATNSTLGERERCAAIQRIEMLVHAGATGIRGSRPVDKTCAEYKTVYVDRFHEDLREAAEAAAKPLDDG